VSKTVRGKYDVAFREVFEQKLIERGNRVQEVCNKYGDLLRWKEMRLFLCLIFSYKNYNNNWE
jgi:hypothetical protein